MVASSRGNSHRQRRGGPVGERGRRRRRPRRRPSRRRPPPPRGPGGATAPSREDRARRSVTAAASRGADTATATHDGEGRRRCRLRTSGPGAVQVRRAARPWRPPPTRVVAPAQRAEGRRQQRSREPLSRPTSPGCMPRPETRFCSRARLRPSSRTAAATTAVARTAPAVAKGSACASAASAVARASTTMSGQARRHLQAGRCGLGRRVARATSVDSTKARWPSRCTSRAAVAASAGPTSGGEGRGRRSRAAPRRSREPAGRRSRGRRRASGRPTPGRSGSHGRSRRAMVASAASAAGSAEPRDRSKTPATVAGARRGSPDRDDPLEAEQTRSPVRDPERVGDLGREPDAAGARRAAERLHGAVAVVQDRRLRLPAPARSTDGVMPRRSRPAPAPTRPGGRRRAAGPARGVRPARTRSAARRSQVARTSADVLAKASSSTAARPASSAASSAARAKRRGATRAAVSRVTAAAARSSQPGVASNRPGRPAGAGGSVAPSRWAG